MRDTFWYFVLSTLLYAYSCGHWLLSLHESYSIFIPFMDTHLLIFLYFVYPLLSAMLASPGSYFQPELLHVCVWSLWLQGLLLVPHIREPLRGVCPPPSCSRIPTLAAPTCDAHTPLQYSSVQSLSRVWLFATPWTAARQASLSITNSQSLLKLMSIETMMPSNHLILCCPLLVLPPIPPSIRVFSNESALRIRWPKNWSFSFNISPSNEYSGLISFGMDWLNLLAVQGTLKSLLQHHSSKASILQHLVLFYSPTLTSIHDHWKNHSFD